jgi:hypothetical protein
MRQGSGPPRPQLFFDFSNRILLKSGGGPAKASFFASIPESHPSLPTEFA